MAVDDPEFPNTQKEKAVGAKWQGRPTKYESRLADVLPALFLEGQSIAEVCVALGIGRTTFYEWTNRHEAFRDAVEVGKLVSEAKWNQVGREAAFGDRRINVAAWIFNMKNRFGWTDRIVAKPDDLNPDEFARRTMEALERMHSLDGGGG